MGIFGKIFPSYNDRQLKGLRSIADKVMALDSEFAAMSDAELAGTTPLLKAQLAEGKTLDDILPRAFAAVREAAWRVIKQKHYYVQVLGGIALHQGRVCQMATGEGKTLVSTLPAYLNALTGKGVHIVTVNEYLAKRDTEWMGKIHRFLGLTVGTVYANQSNAEKKAAYGCDITYGTNNEIGFDYLRDNMAMEMSSLCQRGLNYCIIDEVDSILIDEARTPLIISDMGRAESNEYRKADRFVKSLKPEDYEYEEKEKAIRLTESGITKAERYYEVENLTDVNNASINHYINQCLRANVIMKNGGDYIVENGEVVIVDEFTGRKMPGRRYSNGLHQAIEAKENLRVKEESRTLATISFQNLFRLYSKLSGMTGTAKSEEDEFNTIYNLDVVVIPTNKPCIREDYSDVIYSTKEAKTKAIVRDIKERHKTGQPILIGTVTVDKSEALARELDRQGIKCNVLNAKNHMKEAEIIAQAGRKGAVTIATNMAGRGTDILLGGNPEFLARKEMERRGYTPEQIEIAVSYAEGDEETTRLKKEYGELLAKYTESIAEEKQEVVSLGGLHVMGTDRHESRRIDDQLRGRAGRQGDPGSSVFFISLEDDMARIFGNETLRQMLASHMDDDTPLSMNMINKAIENAQKEIEARNFGARKSVLEYDDVNNVQRNLIYKERMSVLSGADIRSNLQDFLEVYIDTSFRNICPENKKERDLKKMQIAAFYYLPQSGGFFREEDLSADADKLRKEWGDIVRESFENVAADAAAVGIDFYGYARRVLLSTITRRWMEQIDDMENLKENVRLQAYGNQSPINLYKQKGYDLFSEMQLNIQMDTIRYMLAGKLRRGVAEAEEEKSEETQSERRSKFNSPCPCGSGKNYRDCCGREEYKAEREAEYRRIKEQRKAKKKA